MSSSSAAAAGAGAEDAPGDHLTEGEAALTAEAVLTESLVLHKW